MGDDDDDLVRFASGLSSLQHCINQYWGPLSSLVPEVARTYLQSTPRAEASNIFFAKENEKEASAQEFAF